MLSPSTTRYDKSSPAHRGSHAGTATDTSGSVEGAVGIGLGNRNRGSFRSGTGVHGNEATGSDDAVECGTVHGAVTDNRECGSAPRFDHDGIAILELAHVKLASGGRMVRTVRHTVDDERAHATDTFAAVVVEGEAFLALLHLFFVHDVQHFQEGHVRRNIVDLDSFELSLGLGILLTPNLQSQIQSAADAAFSFGRSPLRGSGYILGAAIGASLATRRLKRCHSTAPRGHYP